MAKKRQTSRQAVATTGVAMQVRVPRASLERFRQAAERDNRSLSSWVRDRLERAAQSELGK